MIAHYPSVGGERISCCLSGYELTVSFKQIPAQMMTVLLTVIAYALMGTIIIQLNSGEVSRSRR